MVNIFICLFNITFVPMYTIMMLVKNNNSNNFFPIFKASNLFFLSYCAGYNSLYNVEEW